MILRREQSRERRESSSKPGFGPPECLPPGSNPGRRGAPADPREAFGFAQSRRVHIRSWAGTRVLQYKVKTFYRLVSPFRGSKTQ
jgi:hypothetical protein